MPVKTTLRTIRNFLKNLYFLCFLNGALLASLLYFASESKYETQLFSIIVRKIRSELPAGATKTDFALKAMKTAYDLQSKRYLVFANEHLDGIKANIFHPSTVDLMTGNGACGSYAIVLARILKSNDMKVRIAQMKVNGVYGGHNLVETKTENGWIVLDPTFNLVFKKADGTLSGFNDLNKNWEQYKSQLPADYPPEYNFAGVRYTNWEKIPGVTTTIKALLNIIIGKEKADTISIRPYLLRVYNKLAWLTLLIWLIVSFYTVKRFRNRGKMKLVVAVNQDKNIKEFSPAI